MPEQKHGDVYTVLYAAGVCVVCSLALALAAAGLRPRQERMVELDRRFNVLKAFGAPMTDAAGRRLPAAEIERLYDEHVRERVVEADTGRVVEGRTPRDLSPSEIAESRLLPLYEWVEGDRAERYAFPVSGKGLWSTIYGYLALDGNLERIVGLTFYKHGETPGLGGEIESEAFQSQFRGRRLIGPEGPFPIVIAKGPAAETDRAAEDRLVVDGISGATLTGRGVMEFLNRDIRSYAAFFRTRREG